MKESTEDITVKSFDVDVIMTEKGSALSCNKRISSRSLSEEPMDISTQVILPVIVQVYGQKWLSSLKPSVEEYSTIVLGKWKYHFCLCCLSIKRWQDSLTGANILLESCVKFITVTFPNNCDRNTSHKLIIEDNTSNKKKSRQYYWLYKCK